MGADRGTVKLQALAPLAALPAVRVARVVGFRFWLRSVPGHIMQSAGLPIFLISFPVNFAVCLIGSLISWHYIGARVLYRDAAAGAEAGRGATDLTDSRHH